MNNMINKWKISFLSNFCHWGIIKRLRLALDLLISYLYSSAHPTYSKIWSIRFWFFIIRTSYNTEKSLSWNIFLCIKLFLNFLNDRNYFNWLVFNSLYSMIKFDKNYINQLPYILKGFTYMKFIYFYINLKN